MVAFVALFLLEEYRRGNRSMRKTSWAVQRSWDGGGEQAGAIYRRWSAVEAGRRHRRPLMALGLVGASRSGVAIRGGGADDGTDRAEAERHAGHPGRVVSVGAHSGLRVQRVGRGCA